MILTASDEVMSSFLSRFFSLALDLIRIQNLDWGTALGMSAQTVPNSPAPT